VELTSDFLVDSLSELSADELESDVESNDAESPMAAVLGVDLRAMDRSCAVDCASDS
jgi:hypothetical protein